MHKILFLFCLSLGFVAAAQENFSVLSSNYVPSNSVAINPSSMGDAKTRLDINLFSVAAYVMNNLGYLKNQSAVNYISEKRYEAPVDYDFNLNRSKYHLYSRTVFQGPGFAFCQGDHAFGLALSFKNYTHMRYAPNKLVSALVTRTLPDDRQIEMKNMQLASMVFADIKASYAYTFLKKKRELFIGGISVSKFIPVQGAASRLKHLEAEVLTDTSGLILDLNSDQVLLSSRKATFMSGWGIDLGFTYERMLAESFNYLPNSPKNGCRRNYYLYKIGVSLMDIGNLVFDDSRTEYRGVKTGNYIWERETVNESNPRQAFDQFQATGIVTEDRSQAFVRKLNKMRLPTFASVQLDYNCWRNKIYLNLTWVQRIPVPANRFGIARANVLALTPRFESRFFDVAIPLSLYEYRYPQIGLGFRFWFFTIGTDKLIPILFDSDVYGADIYAALKIPIQYHPKCRKGNRDRFNYYPKWYRWRSKSCNGM